MGTVICLLCRQRLEPDEIDIIASEVGLFLGSKCHCGNLLVRASSNFKTLEDAIEVRKLYVELAEVLA